MRRVVRNALLALCLALTLTAPSACTIREYDAMGCEWPRTCRA